MPKGPDPDDRLRRHEGDDWLELPAAARPAQRTQRLWLALGAAVLAALVAAHASAGALDWTPEPGDDPCVLIVAPHDAAGQAQYAMWRAALGCDTFEAILAEPADDDAAWDRLRTAWTPEHRPRALPPAIPLPAAGWLLLAALAGLGAMKWRKG